MCSQHLDKIQDKLNNMECNDNGYDLTAPGTQNTEREDESEDIHLISEISKILSCADQIATLRIIVEQSLEWNSSFAPNFVTTRKRLIAWIEAHCTLETAVTLLMSNKHIKSMKKVPSVKDSWPESSR